MLVIRDLMVRVSGRSRISRNRAREIATNILADRLKRLDAAGIISAEVEPSDARKVNYRLTEKGIDLAPVLLELLIWGAPRERGRLAPDRKRGEEPRASSCRSPATVAGARFDSTHPEI